MDFRKLRVAIIFEWAPAKQDMAKQDLTWLEENRAALNQKIKADILPGVVAAVRAECEGLYAKEPDASLT